MKKKDKDKIITNIDEIAKGYCYCFNPFEVNKAYLKRFSNSRYESSLFRNELVNLHLEILESNNIFDTYDGIPNEEIDAELRKFYTKYFEKAILEQLEVRKVEIEQEREREKALEAEAKGKTTEKKTNRKKK